MENCTVENEQRPSRTAALRRSAWPETRRAIILSESIDHVDEADEAWPVFVVSEIYVHLLSRCIRMNRSCVKRAKVKRASNRSTTDREQGLIETVRFITSRLRLPSRRSRRGSDVQGQS